MTFTTYLQYVAAVALLILTPGPTMLMCMTNALNHGPFAPQFVVLALTFMAFEFSVLTACALGVSRIAPLLRSSCVVRCFNRVSGGLFALMGGLLLFTRRHA